MVWLPASHFDFVRTTVAASTPTLWVVSWTMLRNTLKYQLKLATDEMKCYQELSGRLVSTE